jgi:hypothetical protein
MLGPEQKPTAEAGTVDDLPGVVLGTFPCHTAQLGVLLSQQHATAAD